MTRKNIWQDIWQNIWQILNMELSMPWNDPSEEVEDGKAVFGNAIAEVSLPEFTTEETSSFRSSAIRATGFYQGREAFKLSELTLPGTHNSYMYKTAKNQTWNIPQQLSYGIRVLELDIHKVKVYKFPFTIRREIKMAHGLQNTYGENVLRGATPVKEIFGQLESFADRNPGEILFLKLEFYETTKGKVNSWNVSWSEIKNELEKSGIGSRVFIKSSAIPTVGEVLNSGKNIILTGWPSNSGFSFSETQAGKNTWDLENLSSIAYNSETEFRLLQAFSTTDILGTGAAYESVNNNQYDFLIRRIQRSWLWNANRPSFVMTDHCDLGDQMIVQTDVMNYPVFQGNIKGLPGDALVHWELIYQKESEYISQYGKSGASFNFPGKIWFGLGWYVLVDLKPVTTQGQIANIGQTTETRGSISFTNQEYRYTSGGGIGDANLNGKTVFLKNQDSGLVLDVAGASVDSGADLLGWTFHQEDNQKWQVFFADGYAQFNAVHSGKLIDVDDSDPFSQYDAFFGRYQYNRKAHFENARVQQNSANDKNQHWYLGRWGDGSYLILSKESGKALTIPSVDRGTRVVTQEPSGRFGQRWLIVEA